MPSFVADETIKQLSARAVQCAHAPQLMIDNNCCIINYNGTAAVFVLIDYETSEMKTKRFNCYIDIGNYNNMSYHLCTKYITSKNAKLNLIFFVFFLKGFSTAEVTRPAPSDFLLLKFTYF